MSIKLSNSLRKIWDDSELSNPKWYYKKSKRKEKQARQITFCNISIITLTINVLNALFKWQRLFD